MSGLLFNFVMVITFIIIGLIIGIVRRNKGADIGEQIMGFMFYGVILGVILSWIIYSFDSEYSHETTEHYYYIYSLKNNNEVNGDFFLGSGSIGEKEYYYYYYKSDYGYERGKLPTSSVSIVETSKTPEIVERQLVYNGSLFTWNNDATEQYIMYVPFGTLVEQFRAY